MELLKCCSTCLFSYQREQHVLFGISPLSPVLQKVSPKPDTQTMPVIKLEQKVNTAWFLPRCIYAGRSSRRQTCPSVRLSVTCVNCDKTNESSADILILYERKIRLVFRTQRMVGGERPLLPEILGQTDPPSFKNEVKTTIFNRYSLVVA